jgi:hypothetical protein
MQSPNRTLLTIGKTNQFFPIKALKNDLVFWLGFDLSCREKIQGGA